MDYYRLKSILEDNVGVPPTVFSEIDYVNKITDESFYKINSLIDFKLTEWKGVPKILRDYLSWDIGSPDAYCLVISPKLKSVLETLTIPKHRYYEAKINLFGKSYKYYVLHFIHDYLDEIIYNKSKFVVIDNIFDNYIKVLPDIKSYKDYQNQTEIQAENLYLISSKKIHFKNHINYDIWGLDGQIIISQKAKQAIQETNISGVEMPNIKDTDMFSYLEVEMPGMDLVLQE